ncbi:hypothetical protein ACVWYG_002263 [Pedobacter sp. UYEF25]
MKQTRFNDLNLRLIDFQKQVAVVCPKCCKKAFAYVNYEEKQARLFCASCNYNKNSSTEINTYRINANFKTASNLYFEVNLWYLASFKNEIFWAFNQQHLLHLEQYISAELRAHSNRTHFTLLERLPKFYHEAKNRKALLKIIEKLKNK